MDPVLKVIIVSALPISELRGGIPLAFALGLNPAVGIITAVLANIAIVPLLFFFLDNLNHHFMKIPVYSKVFNHFVEKSRRKLQGHISKWGYFGLLLFVAIPFPITGAYTGTLAAWFLGLDRKKSLLMIFAGILVAGAIVSTVVLTGTQAFRIFVK